MPKRKLNTKEVIISFLQEHLQERDSFILKNSSIQLKLPDYAAKSFPSKFEGLSPETCSRKWRELRDDTDMLKRNKIEVIELSDDELRRYGISGIEKVFRIRRLFDKQPDLFN